MSQSVEGARLFKHGKRYIGLQRMLANTGQARPSDVWLAVDYDDKTDPPPVVLLVDPATQEPDAQAPPS